MKDKQLFTLALAFFLCSSSAGLWAAPQEVGIRDYFAPLSAQEQQGIRFIILSLATKSKVSLLFQRNALNEAGKRIDHIHPLKLLGYIFSDDELKSAVKKIGGMPWNSFVAGMGESLARSARHKDIKDEYLRDFSQTVGVNETVYLLYIQKDRWNDFINAVRNQLP